MHDSRIEIRKRKGIDTLVSGYSPGKVEESKGPTVVGGSKLMEFLKKYEAFLDHCKRTYMNIGGIAQHSFYVRDPDAEPEPALTPEEINILLQHTTKYENHDMYTWATGKFIDDLITNSYNQGYNNFTMNTRGLIPMDYLGCFPQGYDFCERINNKQLIFNVSGDVKDFCGETAKGSNLSFQSNVGDMCCWGARSCNVTIHGNVGCQCAVESSYSTFLFHGELGEAVGLRAINSVFKTTSKRTLEMLRIYVSQRNPDSGPSKNKIVLVRGGREEVIADYRGVGALR